MRKAGFYYKKKKSKNAKKNAMQFIY